MGQTLTHGIYLPDEGERNCYNGLAGNWSILDGAVGTVAEHTTAIAGKAPAVHTHTKSDITDFPAYGNTAGTICEGNDSRLSDARTPVAHTHGKADITDLFNSANTWSGYNTFTSYIALKENAAIPAGGYGKGIAFQNYQSNRLGYIQPHLTSDNAKRLLIGADSGDVAINSNLIPHANNSYNLGTSTNKWKSFNGVNPGALSFPNLEYSDSNKWIDIKSAITNTAGGDNWYYPAVDGWVFVIASGGAAPDLNVLVFIDAGLNFISGAIPAAESSTGARWCQCLAPAGSRVRIRFNKGSTSCIIEKAFFIPCQGNV